MMCSREGMDEGGSEDHDVCPLEFRPPSFSEKDEFQGFQESSQVHDFEATPEETETPEEAATPEAAEEQHCDEDEDQDWLNTAMDNDDDECTFQMTNCDSTVDNSMSQHQQQAPDQKEEEEEEDFADFETFQNGAESPSHHSEGKSSGGDDNDEWNAFAENSAHEKHEENENDDADGWAAFADSSTVTKDSAAADGDDNDDDFGDFGVAEESGEIKSSSVDIEQDAEDDFGDFGAAKSSSEKVDNDFEAFESAAVPMPQKKTFDPIQVCTPPFISAFTC
jgi:hypothetical protein